ncbi:MAG: glycosyltransferase family 4 protein [Deltaproteobacteria bacterium]|nr:glycosyltransferase family 4 protein [Nannocystaceae bacterium]
MSDPSPRRVLFLSSCVRGGGAGWSLYYLLKHLDRRAIEPLVVVPDRGIFDARFTALGVRVVVDPMLPHRVLEQRFETHNVATHWASATLNATRMARFVRRLARRVVDERIELVHCNNMMVESLGAATAQLSRRPCVLHARNIHERTIPMHFYGGVARMPAVRRVIANSLATALPYRRAAPDKVVVIHNGIDLQEYDEGTLERGKLRARLGLEGRTVVGFTGNLIPRKGIDVLLRALARLIPRHPELALVVLGRVPLGSPVDYGAQYQALAEQLGIADHVHFVGFDPDVRAAVADCDVLALPSLQEPFGRSIIEAMALGTTVLASDVGGIPEIIDHGVHGLLAPPGDDSALAEQLGKLAADPALRARLAGAARARVERDFDVAGLTAKVQAELLAVM